MIKGRGDVTEVDVVAKLIMSIDFMRRAVFLLLVVQVIIDHRIAL